MKLRILALVLFSWTASALAELPEAAEGAFRHIYYSIGVFFAFGLTSMFFSSMLARKIAPRSRELRQLVVVFATIVGCGVGGFMAIKTMR